MIKTLSISLVVLALGLALPKIAQAGGEKYGSAGCGLGSLAWGGKKDFKDSKTIQVLAATTNGTFYSQTFGVSSGTSNCDTGEGNRASLDVYVEVNRIALANDVARGNGETLAGLSQLIGCSNTDALGTVLQKNYTEIFPSQQVDSTKVSQSILRTVERDANLASICQGHS